MTAEISRKSYFNYIVSSNYKPTCGLEQFEVDFHKKMQNPDQQGAIVFDGIARGLLHNGNLSNIKDYFYAENGEHIYNKTVKKLSICNICLKEYNRGLCDQMPDGTRFIAEAIAQNAKISEIDLTNTQLG